MSDEALTSSMEDYLETILQLQQARHVARAKEIGEHLHVNRSSVTTALQALAKRGLINYSPYDFITLTNKGQAAAEDVASRHEVMRQFLVKVLRVEEPEADRAACKLEHSLSGTVLERLTSFMEFVNRCPAGVADWSAGSGFHCTRDKTVAEDICSTCTARVCATQRRKKKRGE